jgi:predicted MPP superfamily phosphohydrolase
MDLLKFLIIPDIHGSSKWKALIEEPHDYTIFLGDYCDSYTHTNKEIFENLKDVIQYKQDNQNCVLLLGNHDVHYALLKTKLFKSVLCSGFRPEMSHDLNELFTTNVKNFQLAFEYKNYLFTHAGVTKMWADTYLKPDLPIADQLNDLYKTKTDCVFTVGKRRGGWSNYGGPLWTDKSEFDQNILSLLPGVHQIVGHTPVPEITTCKHNTDHESVVFCDYLDVSDYALILNI